MSIGDRIKEAREKLNLSRVDLANLIDVTPSAISNYENGISSPKEPVLFKLFSALKCDANFLFQDEMKQDQPDPNNPPSVRNDGMYKKVLADEFDEDEIEAIELLRRLTGRAKTLAVGEMSRIVKEYEAAQAAKQINDHLA